MSRLLTTLLLLKSGYSWIEYVSFEHEIENNKRNYYRSLRSCQAQRPNEDIIDWIEFFLESMLNIQRKLDEKLEWTGVFSKLSEREKEVYTFVENNAGCKTGEMSKRLGITISTARGIIYSHTKGHLINKLILPIINPSILLSKKLEKLEETK